LTIRGSRLSAAGPVVPQPVTASYCAFQWFPLLDAAVVGGGATPLVALARPGPDGRVDIVGHAPAVRADIGRTSPNLIVHFGDAESAGRLDAVRHALRKSGRADAATAIVAVLESDQMAHARYVPGVVYAEQQGDDWPRAWGIGVVRRPATFVISPTGEITWQYEGEADATGLSDALRRVLVARSAPSVTTVTAGVRIGHAPPNFLFAPAAGSELTLHKLVGRPVVLVFWRSTSRPSVDAVLALGADPGWKGAPVLAINDGESGEAATQTASDARFAATVVPDPSQSISRAYGISGWPTTVLIDALGVVREVRQGQGFADRPADVRQETDGVAGQ
jgi:peroxiredoxin